MATATTTAPCLAWTGILAKEGVLVALVGLIIVAIVFNVQFKTALALFLAKNQANKGVGSVLFVVLYVIATVTCMPASILTLGAGYIFGLALGTAVVVVGASIGMVCTYGLGRVALRSYVEGLVKQSPRFRQIDVAIRYEGWKLVLLLRLAPIVPYNLLNYALPATSVTFVPYAVASVRGDHPGHAAVCCMSGSLARNIQDIASGAASNTTVTIVSAVLSGVCIIVLVVVVTIMAKRAIARAGVSMGEDGTELDNGDGEQRKLISKQVDV